ncbi:hypothetical protein BpHYR1_038895 [Brachionus plicatilis]|uniref:Uncharacterized protein n=1 Tax=Brachionus plicatilis TaxID=10195 RepID=A0A3M7P8A4_BRAPC|nr:hypothetical protein BpHYR1_038895 [Brachionus plicatilis]
MVKKYTLQLIFKNFDNNFLHNMKNSELPLRMLHNFSIAQKYVALERSILIQHYFGNDLRRHKELIIVQESD